MSAARYRNVAMPPAGQAGRGFLTFARLAWAVLTGLLVTTGFALLDLLRPPGDRGSLAHVG